MSKETTMEITGEIQDFIYQNEINSYTIATFNTEEEEITVVGYLPFVHAGDNLKLIGKFVEHKEYGTQFKIDTFEKLMPRTTAALERYLANGNIKGVGEAIAKRIVRTFGDETLYVFQKEPERLAQVRGISENRAKEIAEEFLENWEVWQIVGFLERFGIGAEYAKKVYTLLGVHAIEEIEANPYLLLDIAKGVDFKQVDKMALDLGINYDNEKRVQSGIKYGLIRSTNSGHACVLKENLIEFVIGLLDVTAEMVEDNLINLKVNNEIVIEEREEMQFVYLYAFYVTEEGIALRIKRLQNANNTKKIEKIQSALKKVEKNSGIILSEKQKEAVQLVNDNNVTIITGGPGTGKTTIIKSIIDVYEEKKYKIVLSAPTGRAAKRMTETTKREASTLHRLLEIGKTDEDSFYQSSLEYEGTPIDADLIIVDEMSMVDMFLMNQLLKCIYQGTKLILVGDEDQLASVGPGSVLKDLIQSDMITTIHLDKIFRQAAKSKIILNAHRVNQGKMFFLKKDAQNFSMEERPENIEINEEELENEIMNEDLEEDFFFIKERYAEKMVDQVLSLCTGRLKNYGDYDFFQNIQVLSPTKRGPLGTRELNKELQAKLNPNIGNLPERGSMGAVFRAGDRVMQIKNNYDIYWEREENQNGKKQIGSGVFNGEIGTIINIDELEKQVEIQFDDEKVAWYPFSELDQIEHSYAITIHKAQRK